MSLTLHSSADEPKSSDRQPISFHTSWQVKYCSAEQLRKILSFTPQITITATGSSMTPFVRSGERVTLNRVENPFVLKNGNIILFANSKGRMLLHRIVTAQNESKNFTLQTKGDNRFVADTAILPDKVIAKVSRLEKELPILGFHSFDLESKSWKLVGRTLAWSSRFNIYLRCRRFLSRLRRVISVKDTNITSSVS